MSYKHLPKPRVRSFEFEDEGDHYKFFMRKPTALELIRRGDVVPNADGQAATPESKEKVSKEFVAQYIVNEDGSKIDDDDVEAIFGMEATAFRKFQDMVIARITPDVGEQKNA